MRLGVKSMLLMLLGYSLLIAAFAFGVDRWLRAFETDVTSETASLLARENAALLSERTYGALEARDSESRQLLRERVHDLTLLSETVSSITVVDAEGRVVASDRLPTGQPAEMPAVVFRDGWTVRPRATQAPRFLRGGDYVVDVPLIDKGRLVGYVAVAFHGERVDMLYEKARLRLLEGAVAGLVGVVALGGFLQFQISRRAASIAETLESSIPGTGPTTVATPAGDEFSRVLRAAGRVRQAITDARRQTSRIEESFSALAQALQVGVLLLRRDRDPDFANPRALELLGASSLEELKQKWPLMREPLAAVLAGLGGQPSTVRRALDVPLPGGEGRALRFEPYRLGPEDRDEYLVLLNDPEILDSLETDIRLASQLQGMARVYRTVAHELRAPLSAMMIHLDLLRESLTAGGTTDEQKKEAQDRHVAVLRDELERLNRSLSETLTQAPPPPTPADKFDLRDALADLGTLLAPQARRQGVSLRISMPDQPVLLVGHRDRLKQGFLNIAVNALEAMPKGGQMSLEMELQAGRVKVSITDTGPGIPADLLARIYERDFTTKGGGSGIGLYVARTLVEIHGGEIRAESREGEGTRVEVALPILARS